MPYIWNSWRYSACGFNVVVFGFPLVYMAANGAFILLTGNAILRTAHLAHYTTNAVAAEIGLIGGVLATLLVGFVTCLLPRDE
ncbi:hypothetical protein BJ912DRAFT_998229, partial [Pholiota molesta]